MFRDMSPSFGPTHFPGNAPPSPPFSAQNDPLDDIYGSAPSSPVLASRDIHIQSASRERADEILSDLPSRQRTLDTDAYREGLANSKGQYVQEGFDEGYSLGANLGLQVGYILGVFQGFTAALRGHDETRWNEAKEIWESAQNELAIEKLLGKDWVDEEGIWKWDVTGKEDEVTFKEVADQHPVMQKWMGKVHETARKWGVDLDAVEKSQEAEVDEES